MKAELSEETGLADEDLVAVSYMGDELDLETVGDIIAIIEEKVRACLSPNKCFQDQECKYDGFTTAVYHNRMGLRDLGLPSFHVYTMWLFDPVSVEW